MKNKKRFLENEIFYNYFHKSSKVINKIINRKDITYRISLNYINKVVDTLSLKNENLSILDYGCGVGTISLFLASKGHKVTGVDISSKAIEIAKKSAINIGMNKNIDFISFNQFSSLKRKYDLIMCFEVLEHINNHKDIFSRLVKDAKKNGYILISVPSNNAPLYKLGMLNIFDINVGHLRRYRKKDLVLYAEENNNLDLIGVYEEEGILRNAFYTLKPLGFMLKFIKGVLSDIFTYLDKLSIKMFGASNYYALYKKK